MEQLLTIIIHHLKMIKKSIEKIDILFIIFFSLIILISFFRLAMDQLTSIKRSIEKVNGVCAFKGEQEFSFNGPPGAGSEHAINIYEYKLFTKKATWEGRKYLYQTYNLVWNF